ncbi:hypothetical protein BC941DRAFT_444048 [Chlamydoabsidia padenii]|nr:hypothetical protein BC941DRAFT_444048 [Chlamydoabsidia padenii]
MVNKKVMVGNERFSSRPLDQDEETTNRRPTLRHAVKRRSSGARYMKRSNSWQDTTQQQALTSISSTTISTSPPSIVSIRQCAKPVEQTFHATANHHASFYSPAANTLRSVTNQSPLVSHFINQSDPQDHDYLYPMLSSLRRCLVAKSDSQPSHLLYVDQHIMAHRHHIRQILDHSDNPVSSSPSPTPTPWVASLWDRVWHRF